MRSDKCGQTRRARSTREPHWSSRAHFDRVLGRLAHGLARVSAERSRVVAIYLVSRARSHVLGRSVRPAEIDRTLMRRNRLILTNRSADRTAWSTLLNYLRFIKYISNAVPCECVRARFHKHDERARTNVGRISLSRVCARACAAPLCTIRVRVCTTAVHNV